MTQPRIYQKGFTLIELLVVVSIVSIVAAMVLSNMPLYKGNIALDREAGRFALMLRKAQQYSISVRRFQDTIATIPSGCNGNLYKAQFPAYGVTASLISTTTYSIFADPDCDNLSNTYAGDLIESSNIENRMYVADICTDIDVAIPQCASTGAGYTKADIWYIRPGPKIVLTLYNSGGPMTITPAPQNLKVVLTLPGGGKRSIAVRTSGQVSIKHEP